MQSTPLTLPAKVKIELPSQLLVQLITEGQLKGNDCKCLDTEAKKVLWHSLLCSSIK